MGKDERKAVSRVQVANLPKTSQTEAKFVGPLGLFSIDRIVEGAGAGKVLHLGQQITIVLGDAPQVVMTW